MKKIVMLNCLRANSVCTGAACLQAFNAKTKTFARYGDEPLELVAFFRCNGCDAPQDDAGMEEKIERLLQLRPDAAHMGVCTRRKADGTRCPTIQKVGERGVLVCPGSLRSAVGQCRPACKHGVCEQRILLSRDIGGVQQCARTCAVYI